jgi:ribosomal protein L4
MPERNEIFEKSVRNIPTVKALLWSNLNPHDMLNYERIVLFQGAVGKVVEVLK